MKKTFVSIVLLLSCSLFVSAADIYVNNSGQSGTYTSITSALAAAAPGDRIFVSPYGDYTENLTISQSVTLASAVSGTSFSVIGSLTINGAPNMVVKVVGGEFSNQCFTSAGTSLFNMADLYLIDCKFTQINGGDYVRMHVLFCDMGIGNCTISIRHGEVRGCRVNRISIGDGPNAGVGDTLFIIANECANITWNNDDNYFYIANNYVYRPSFVSNGIGACFSLNKWYYNSAVNNRLDNNIFSNASTSSSSSTIYIGFGTNSLNNIYAYNNIIENRATCSSTSTNIRAINRTSSTTSGGIQLYNNVTTGNYSLGAYSKAGNTLLSNPCSELTLAVDSGCIDSQYCVDKGAPGLEFYDIDMTRNDIGTYGGPYSKDNYLEVGTGNARIYDLDMPIEIWPGQTPQVNAKAAHTK